MHFFFAVNVNLEFFLLGYLGLEREPERVWYSFYGFAEGKPIFDDLQLSSYDLGKLALLFVFYR